MDGFIFAFASTPGSRALPSRSLFAPEPPTGMRVHLASLAMLIAALSGVARAGAQQAARKGESSVAIDTTSAVDTASPDTVAADARGVASAPHREDHWIAPPGFLELRLMAAHHSQVPSRMPGAAYRNMYIVDVRAGWTITSNRVLSLEYAPSLVPLAISTRNPEAYIRQETVVCQPGKSCDDYNALDVRTIPRYTNTYGFGITPVGIQLRLFRSWPVQLLTYANGGALWFTHPLPDPAATRFNFTAELGGAVQVNLPDRYALALGYSWHHTSNGGTGRVNPGVNSRALTFAIIARRSR